MPRKDKLFTRKPDDMINAMREAKINGASLKEITEAFDIAKSTASLYCRDLFWHPNRIYQTEGEARDAVAMRGIGTDHSIYRKCLDCGGTIRNENKRCLSCNLKQQAVNGVLDALVILGSKHRFQEKSLLKKKIPKAKHLKRREHNYRRLWDMYLQTGYGAYRLSKLLSMPLSTTSSILTNIKRNKALI